MVIELLFRVVFEECPDMVGRANTDQGRRRPFVLAVVHGEEHDLGALLSPRIVVSMNRAVVQELRT
ncbi:MAG: hypothetical protein JWN14_5159, partial [Chthonomonadales bacterium]|nr:hypothetical protein [Chthonomonadales bacterium]